MHAAGRLHSAARTRSALAGAGHGAVLREQDYLERIDFTLDRVGSPTHLVWEMGVHGAGGGVGEICREKVRLTAQAVTKRIRLRRRQDAALDASIEIYAYREIPLSTHRSHYPTRKQSPLEQLFCAA